jgi:hypothetical protein
MSNHSIMSEPSFRRRTKGAYVIRSAESRPRAVKVANPAQRSSSSVVSLGDKTLVLALRDKRRSEELHPEGNGLA